MSAHQAMYPIRTMARVLKVSASGYYAWRSRPASARATADADLTRHIRTIHAGSHGTYGAPRVHAELKADGLSVGRKRIARLMRAAGIAGVSRCRSAPITIHVGRFRRSLQGSRRSSIDRLGRRRLRQCDVREFLRHPRMRADRSAPLPISQRGADGRLSVHRRLLQPVLSPLGPWVSFPHRIRKET